MDISSYQECLKCSKHPTQNIIFIQVNQIQDNKNIFYCASCIQDEDQFKTSNYIQFQQVLGSLNDFSIVNWPPFNDSSIRNQVSKLLSQNSNQNGLIYQINSFFDDLKLQIIKKIDDCQKTMIKKAQEFPKYEDQIKEKLKEIKIIDSFKNILLNNDLKMSVKDRQWREFINKIKKEQQNYTNEIKQIFDLLDYNKQLIDFESPNKMRASILQLIEDINFIKKDQQLNEQNHFNNKDILPNLLIIQSSYNKMSLGQKMQKLENNSIQIISLLNTFGSYYSNLVIDRNIKYKFRFQFQRIDQQNGGFFIGLTLDKTKDNQYFIRDQQTNQTFFNELNQGYIFEYGIQKFLKGNVSDTKDINCLELRVCIKDKLLEVVDYPTFNHRYVIRDQIKNNLQAQQNFRLAIFLQNSITVTLISAQICDYLDN